MRSIRAIIAFAFGAALAGCQDTTFERQPSESVAACDAHFVGKWRMLAPVRDAGIHDRQDDDQLFLIVDRNCKRWRFIEDGKDDEKTERQAHIAFARIGDLPILTLKLDADTPEPNDPSSRWKNGYYYLRYEFQDKTIRLYSIDHKRMAHLIVDGMVHGRTERISREPETTPKAQGDFLSRQRDDLHNFVAGDTQEMARVAQLADIFDRTEFYTLKPARDDEIFGPVKKPAKP